MCNQDFYENHSQYALSLSTYGWIELLADSPNFVPLYAPPSTLSIVMSSEFPLPLPLLPNALVEKLILNNVI